MTDYIVNALVLFFFLIELVLKFAVKPSAKQHPIPNKTTTDMRVLATFFA